MNIEALQKWETAQANQPVLADGRYPCRFPGCSSSYKHDGVNRRRREMSYDPPPTIIEIPAIIYNTAPDGNDPALEDDVFNYHSIIADL